MNTCPINSALNQMYDEEDRAQDEYLSRDYPEWKDILKCIDNPVDAYIEAIGIESMSDDYMKDCFTEMHAVGELSDAEFGRMIKERVLKYMAEIAEPKLYQQGQFRSNEEDVLGVIL